MKITAQMLFFFALSISSFYGCKEKHSGESAISSWPDYKKGEALLAIKGDSAFYYFNKIVNTAKDSLHIATAYNYMAIIQSDAGDYFGSQESLLLSLKYLNEQKEKDYVCLSSDYNELGILSFNLKNYDAAIDYYNLAIKFARDDNYKAVYINNQANCYKEKREYAKALEYYSSIIDQNKTDKKNYARVLANMAITKWLRNNAYNATPELLKALQIQKDENDDWGFNLSYGYLADYYFKSHPDSSLLYAEKLYKIAQQLKSPDDEISALQKLIVLSSAKEGKTYFIRYQYLNDSLQTARNNAKNQFALIRFDAEKNKADNLKLQRDNSEKQLQIIRQRIILYSALFVLLFGSIIVAIWYKKRKQQMIWESENVIRENKLKTSQKVHDVVANGLYTIMAEIEHKDDMGKEVLLDKMEVLYEKSRDISYEQPGDVQQDFEVTIARLLKSFASPETNVLIVGNSSISWNNISMLVKKELELVLQELMINMKKHSSAQNVVVKFERHDRQVKVQYTDDGIGLPAAFKYGNGLTNTGNRIKTIGGGIIFDKQVEKGIKIQVYFPVT